MQVCSRLHILKIRKYYFTQKHEVRFSTWNQSFVQKESLTTLTILHDQKDDIDSFEQRIVLSTSCSINYKTNVEFHQIKKSYFKLNIQMVCENQ